jgi:toxin ParE1/3/4
MSYYDDQQPGLGLKFLNNLHKHLHLRSHSPFFPVRFDQVRCLPLIKFPYLVHYTVDEMTRIVVIRAVFHTSQDPEKWKT